MSLAELLNKERRASPVLVLLFIVAAGAMLGQAGVVAPERSALVAATASSDNSDDITSEAPKDCSAAINKAVAKQTKNDGPATSKAPAGFDAGTLDACYGAARKEGAQPDQNTKKYTADDYECVGRSGYASFTSGIVTLITVAEPTLKTAGKCSVKICNGEECSEAKQYDGVKASSLGGGGPLPPDSSNVSGNTADLQRQLEDLKAKQPDLESAYQTAQTDYENCSSGWCSDETRALDEARKNYSSNLTTQQELAKQIETFGSQQSLTPTTPTTPTASVWNAGAEPVPLGQLSDKLIGFGGLPASGFTQASPEYTALTGLSHQVSESTFTGANSWWNTDQMFQNVPTANTPDSFTAASWDNARPLQMADLPQSYQLPMSGPTSFIQTASLAGLEPTVQSLSGGWDTSGFKNISDATWKAGANDAAALANFKPDTIMFNDGNLDKVVGNMRSEFGATPEFRTDSQAVFRNDDGMTFVQTDVGDGKVAQTAYSPLDTAGFQSQDALLADARERAIDANIGDGGYNEFEAALDAQERNVASNAPNLGADILPSQFTGHADWTYEGGDPKPAYDGYLADNWAAEGFGEKRQNDPITPDANDPSLDLNAPQTQVASTPDAFEGGPATDPNFNFDEARGDAEQRIARVDDDLKRADAAAAEYGIDPLTDSGRKDLIQQKVTAQAELDGILAQEKRLAELKASQTTAVAPVDDPWSKPAGSVADVGKNNYCLTVECEYKRTLAPTADHGDTDFMGSKTPLSYSERTTLESLRQAELFDQNSLSATERSELALLESREGISPTQTANPNDPSLDGGGVSAAELRKIANTTGVRAAELERSARETLAGCGAVGCTQEVSAQAREAQRQAELLRAQEAELRKAAASQTPAADPCKISAASCQKAPPQPPLPPERPQNIPETPPAGQQSSGGFGQQFMQGLLGGLAQGLLKAMGQQNQPQGPACPTDTQGMQQYQLQYQQQLQQYQYQMQQYQYQQQMAQYQAQAYGISPYMTNSSIYGQGYYGLSTPTGYGSIGGYSTYPPQPPVPCSPSSGGGTGGTGTGQCGTFPPKPDDSSCSGGSWRITTTSALPTSPACPVWQCVRDGGGGTMPAAEISCEPKTAEEGATIAISFKCTNATESRSIGFNAGGAHSGSVNQKLENVPDGVKSVRYGIACINGANSTTTECAVEVARPRITLTASPKTVQPGQTSTIGWVTTDMRSCTISSPDQADFTARNASATSTSGVATTSPISRLTRFELECETLTGGERVATTSVDIAATSSAASISSTIDGSSGVPYGATTTIQWKFNLNSGVNGTAVALYLYDVGAGRTLSLIGGRLIASSSYLWVLPEQTDVCTGDGLSVCPNELVAGNSYAILAELYRPEDADLSRNPDPDEPKKEVLDHAFTPAPFRFGI